VARPGSSVYNLAKFGANAFTEALRQEMIGHRVRVSVVEPGTVDTELATHLRPGIRQAAQTQIEAIQPLRPEDIADAKKIARGRASVMAKVPDDVAARAVAGWTALFGMVSFELFGQFENVITDRDAFFEHSMRCQGRLTGLSP